MGVGEIGRVAPPARKPETDMSDDEYMAHEHALTSRWIELLDDFAKLPAHRLQAVIKMLEHHTDELASVLRPRLLLPTIED